MAYTDQNIVITPNIGSSTDVPKIVFTASNATTTGTITLRAYPVNSGQLSFEGSAGQLFSINNSLVGTLFSVNDISGIPSITVQDTGLIQLAPYSGYVSIASNVASTSTNSGALQVVGGVGISRDLNVGGTLTATNLRQTSGTIQLGTTNLSGANSVGIGASATAVGVQAVAVGVNASAYSNYGVSIGANAVNQGQYAISIGYSAGNTTAGNANTIAIGYQAGSGSTVPGSIIISSTSTNPITTTTNVGFYVNPIRADATSSATTWGVYYNPVTRELTTATAGTGGGGTVASGTGTTSTFIIQNSTQATSTNTGALQVYGGVGVGGNTYVGGNLYTNGAQVLPTSIQEFTATGGQTIFTVAGGYTVGSVQVFANGVALGSTDFTASNGTTVVLTDARRSGDTIRTVSGLASSSINNITARTLAYAVVFG